MDVRLGFQVRTAHGKHRVFLVSVNGRPVPTRLQSAVYADQAQSRAQLISDALNNGLLRSIELALRAAGSED